MLMHEKRLKMHLFIGFTLITLAWTTLILYLGSQPASEQDMKPFLQRLISQESLREILPAIEFRYGKSVVSTEEPYRFLQFIARKTAHFLVYGILSLLAVQQQMLHQNNKAKAFLMALFYVTILAIIDETVQYYIPGRTGMVQDVYLDISGSLLALIWLCFRKE